MFTLIPRLIRKFQRIIFSNIQGQSGSKVNTEECEGEDDGWMDKRVRSLGLGRIWSINTRQSHKPIN
jgi:hypothetical protein